MATGKENDPKKQARDFDDLSGAIERVKANYSGLTSVMIEYNGIIGNSYDEQDRILELLEKEADKIDEKLERYKEEIDLLGKKAKLEEDESKRLDDYLKQYEKWIKRRDENRKQQDDALDGTLKMKKGFDALGKSGGLLGKVAGGLSKAFDIFTGRIHPALVALEAFAFVFNALLAVSERVLKWQNELQKSLSGLALRFGSTTDAIIGMRDEGLKQLLDPKGLGGLGMSLDEIIGKLGDFNEAMVWTDKVSQKTAADMIKFGRGIGYSATEVGELAKSFTSAGQSMEDLKGYMKAIASGAAQAGVSAKSLAKQFQGAGKLIYDLSGPERRKDLIHTAMELAKVGTGLDKIAGFTQMTMSFDKTIDSMAKLNTVFGTHINAMEVFAERDPAKQFKLIQDAVAGAGVDINNMNEMEKKFMMDALHFDAQTLDAMITRSKMTDAELKQEDQRAQLAKKKAEAEGAYEKSLMRSKSMLLAEQAITANINNMLTKEMAPFYEGWAMGGGILGGAEAFDSYTQKWTDRLNGFSTAMGQQGLAGYMLSIGNTFGNMWDVITEFITSGSVATFLTGITATFSVIMDVISGIISIVAPLLKLLMWVVGKVLEVIAPVLKLISAGLKLFGTVVGAGMDLVGQTVTGDEKANSNFDKRMNVGMKSFDQDQTAGIEGLAAGTFGAASRPQSTNNVVSARAEGGQVQKGQLYRINEKRETEGPELFRAPVNGEVINGKQSTAIMNNIANGGGNTSSMGGDQNIHVHVTLDGEKIQDIMYKNSMRRQA
jgi:hypothetical protein